MVLVEENKDGLQISVMVGNSYSAAFSQLIHFLTGITPFVNPEDLKFYFQEIHRLTK